MNMKKKLYIEHCKKEEHEPESIRFENLGYYYDLQHKIGIQKKSIFADLKIGLVYDFTYEDYNDTDTYSYIVLKKEENIYYIAEYYNGFCETKESCLGDCWTKCNVKETLDINLSEWKTRPVRYYEELPDMREKVKEYISELDAEIDRCTDEAESILAAIGDYEEKPMPTNYIRLEERLKVLAEVKNDLQGRLDELI